MQIAYLVPEFPGQTHIMFWRERRALENLGVRAFLVSTRRPPRAIRSHNWSTQAEQETFYLNDLGARRALRMAIYFCGLGPKVWSKLARVVFDRGSLADIVSNMACLVLAVNTAMWMRAQGLRHVHVHSCGNAALVATLARMMGNFTYSLTLHGALSDYGRQQPVKWRNAAFAIVITRLLHEQVHKELSGCLPDQVGLAPMGVDPQVFKRAARYVPWRGDGPLRLFSCGRLNPSKGHHVLVRAIAQLRERGMDVRLEIAGEDEFGGSGFHQDLNKLIAELQLAPSVVLLGAVDEERVLQGMTSAHLFVLASPAEPLGVALMEAMSCEMPVIATRFGGVPELITHEVDGWLIDPSTPDAIAAAIARVAGDPPLAMRLSAAARSKVMHKFSSTVSASQLKDFLGALERQSHPA
jgi:glycosyltransferase involved in cell wall biosynthesis